jgi:hypothetical protein
MMLDIDLSLTHICNCGTIALIGPYFYFKIILLTIELGISLLRCLKECFVMKSLVKDQIYIFCFVRYLSTTFQAYLPIIIHV